MITRGLNNSTAAVRLALNYPLVRETYRIPAAETQVTELPIIGQPVCHLRSHLVILPPVDEAATDWDIAACLSAPCALGSRLCRGFICA